uniref:Phosphatidylinositol glycan anchor biosynthesis class G n=1 Tax=Eptatretus burgeri TaxID=7764 RepID=A0A8C4NHP1_EPTBU
MRYYLHVVQVDDNVTRHLSRELSSTSWDILVLHYLGLDHIGHVYGPRSPLACPKLREMDAIIQKIDNSLQAEVHSTLNLSTQVDASVLPNLLVVCSDHGMSNAGSHGGSSDEEMLTPLIFFSSAFPVATADLSPHAEQTDIAVTLSFTLGLPVPRNSLGHLLLPVMAHLPLRDKLRFLHINGWQLTVLLAPSGSHSLNRGHALFKATEMEHGAWIDLVHAGNVSSKDLSILGSRLMKRYQEALQFMSQSLGESLAQYDIYSMVLGIILEFQVLLILLLHHHFQFTVLPPTVALSVAFGVGLLFLHTVFCTHPTPPALCHTHALIIVLIFTTLACLNGVLAALLWKFLQRHRQGLSNTMTDKQQWLLVGGMNNIRTFLQLGCVGHAMSQAASSFVEEEHMIWYFLLSSLWLMIGYDVWQLNETCRWRDEHYTHKQMWWPKMVGLLIVMVFCRLLRGWNQTGVNWADQADISDWLNSPGNESALTAVSAVSLIGLFWLVGGPTFSFFGRFLLAFGLVGVWAYRCASGTLTQPAMLSSILSSEGVREARLAYICVFLLLAMPGIHSLLGTCLGSSSSEDDQPTVLAGKITLCPKNRLGDQASLPPHKNTESIHGLYARWQHDECSQREAISVKERINSHPQSGFEQKDVSEAKTRHLAKIYQKKEGQMGCHGISAALTLLLSLLLRPHNLPVLAMWLGLQHVLSSWVWPFVCLSPFELAIIYYWLGQAAFFHQGNSNGLATVDVAAGYTGMSSHSGPLAVILTAFCTYSGPIIWAMALMKEIRLVPLHTRASSIGAVSRALALCRALPLTLYLVFVMVQRHHLFIWSVFAPKLLYETTHTLALFAFLLILTTCI